MKYGKIFVDSEIDRVNVHWDDGTYGDGYHCGEVVEIKVPAIGEWEKYRIEYNHEQQAWYFAGMPKAYGNIPVGTEIRSI